KERDPEDGLDNSGARYYTWNYGRFTTPDPINLTSRRLLSPANTLNKYTYAGNNPLEYFDPDGQDITVFYTREALVSHIYLTVFNQNTGEVRSLDWNPEVRDASWDVKMLAGVSSPPNFVQKMPDQVLDDDYASLTIQTSPEEAQKVIDWIKQLEKNPP